jgi:hypothetical protein
LTLEHIPFGWNQPNGICLLQQLTRVRAFHSDQARAAKAAGGSDTESNGSEGIARSS